MQKALMCFVHFCSKDTGALEIQYIAVLSVTVILAELIMICKYVMYVLVYTLKCVLLKNNLVWV